MSATISHTSSEEVEDGGAGACALCVLCVCISSSPPLAKYDMGGLVSGSQASSTTVDVTGLMSVAVAASPCIWSLQMAVVRERCV